jgi:hypothetical protein
MIKRIVNTLPDNHAQLKWLSIALTVAISLLLTVLGIYGIEDYGLALFVMVPVLLGAGPTLIYGLKRQPTADQSRMSGFLALGIYTASLLVFAIEGIICLAMAAPIGFLLTLLGSFIGYTMIRKMAGHATTTLLLLIFSIPTTAFIEKNTRPTLTSVVTSVEIQANPQTVWNNVIEFRKLDPPTEFIFKTGIAYPVDANIVGTGVGAMRHCNFTTGSFVEPITVWDEPKLLRFDVLEQPDPMKELSLWDVNAPHLHDYFVSKQGQFKLTALPNGRTLLEGTTWYYHNIRPTFYWRLWSNHIVHKIHRRVLNHIKKNAERDSKAGI